MIIHTTNAVAGPFLLLVWLLDFYVCVACARFLFAQVNNDWARRAAAKLAPIADSVPDAIARAIAQQGISPIPRWLLWLIVIICTVFIRSTLLTFALHAH